MNKLDQKITKINTQIPVLVRKKSNLLAIELGAKGGEGSGRYPSGSGSQEKISETRKPDYPVTDKSQYVRDGLSSTSHDIIDVNIKQGETSGNDVVQVEAESRDPNAPKGETTTLTVQIFSKLDENGDVAELTIDKVQDPDRNEVGTSPAFDKILQANIRDAIATHNDYYKNPKKHMSELDRMIKGISQEIVQLEQKVSLLNRIDFASKGGVGSGRYPAGSSQSSRLKDNPSQGMFNFDQPKIQTPTPSVPSKIEPPPPSVIPKIEPPPPTPKQIWDARENARVADDRMYGDGAVQPARPYVEPPKVRTPEEQVTAADLHAQSESNRIALAQNQQTHRNPNYARDVAQRELTRRIDPLADPKVPLKPLPPPTVELPKSIIDGSGDEYRNNVRISYLNDRGERMTGPKPLPEPIPRRTGPGFGGRPNRMWTQRR
jgi:hypothetical protein